MTGCEHNTEREILYPSEHAVKEGYISYIPGDVLILRCPRDCPDVVVELTSCHTSRRKNGSNGA